jgi:hypothetical protein
MERDDDRTGAPDQPAVDRLRHRLRGIAIVVVLALIVFRVVGAPLIRVVTGVEIEDGGVILFSLLGTLLVMLGLEVPSFLPGGPKR